MKTGSSIRKSFLLKFLPMALLTALVFSQTSTRAATDTARIVKYGQNDIVPVKAKLRFSTLIILPEKEEILDFTTGDKEFWQSESHHGQWPCLFVSA